MNRKYREHGASFSIFNNLQCYRLLNLSGISTGVTLSDRLSQSQFSVYPEADGDAFYDQVYGIFSSRSCIRACRSVFSNNERASHQPSSSGSCLHASVVSRTVKRPNHTIQTPESSAPGD